MLLTAPQLPNQKNCIYDHAGNNQGEEDDAKKQQHPFTPVENDPPHVQGDRQRNQAYAQAKKEDDRSTSARNAHGFTLILQPSGALFGCLIGWVFCGDNWRGRTNDSWALEGECIVYIIVQLISF
jgi:hypothetical protein